MEVTYLKSISPIKIKKKPTKQMIALSDSLLNSEPVKVYQVIHSFSFPKLKNFDINSHIGKNLTDVLEQEVPGLLKSFSKYPDCNLRNGKVLSFADLTLLMSCCNAIFDINKLPVVNTPDYQYIYGKKEAIEFLNKYPSDDTGILVFKFRTSRSKLNVWLDDSWKFMKNLNKKLPTNNLDGRFYADINSNLPKNFAKDLLIYLHQKNQSPYSKIANSLSDLFPNDTALMDVDQIKSRCRRIKKYFANSKKSSDLMNVR